MKKLLSGIGLTILVIAAILGITGGVVQAASPESSLVEKINSIIAKLDNSNYGLEAIRADAVRMHYASGQITVQPGGPWEWTIGGEWSEVRHVSVTFKWTVLVDPGAVFYIVAYWPDNPNGAFVTKVDNTTPMTTDTGAATVDFNASEWAIKAFNLSGDPYYINYVAMETYVPEPAP